LGLRKGDRLSPANWLILQTARQQWRLISFNLLMTLLQTGAEGVTLGTIYLAVGVLTGGHLPQLLQQSPLAAWDRTAQFAALLALAVALQITKSLAMYGAGVSTAYFSARMDRDFSERMHRLILSFSFPCASRYRVGDLLNYASTAGGTVAGQINLGSVFFSSVLFTLLYLAVLLSISPWLLLVALLMAAVVVLLQKKLLPRIDSYNRIKTDLIVRRAEEITEHIQGLRLLHTLGLTQQASDHYAEMNLELERMSRREARVNNLTGPINQLLPIVAIAAISLAGALLFRNRVGGALPSLVTFVIALQRINAYVGGLANLSNGFAATRAQVNRLNAILTTADKTFNRQGGVPFQGLQREVVFEGVGLRYAPDLPQVLSDLNLRLPKGNTLALVGASGAGKSSIADLLVGLYDPNQGRILVDGVDLQQLELSSWQQRLGVVSQDTFLFNASIGANIAYGCTWASQEDVERAARGAHADEFIRAIPEGYNAMIGERGFKLSGGQRQRISLARAFLRRPDLLVLDEATSALDSQSERLVQQALEQFEGQHTVLVIAHRLSTICNADLICVMEKGRIVERGRHAELLAQGGAYAALWQQQSSQRQKAGVPLG
jgi:ATP-binding cassette subfamily B protein/subfamily B ATP-binding cassette protein MsbA